MGREGRRLFGGEDMTPEKDDTNVRAWPRGLKLTKRGKQTRVTEYDCTTLLLKLINPALNNAASQTLFDTTLLNCYAK